MPLRNTEKFISEFDEDEFLKILKYEKWVNSFAEVAANGESSMTTLLRSKIYYHFFE